MAVTTSNGVETVGNALVFRRTFNAPIETVFAMFGGEHIGEWWAPRPYRCATQRMEFRSGGVWEYVMVPPSGSGEGGMRVVNHYQEVTPPTRIVWNDYFVDGEGNKVMENLASTKTIELTRRGKQTEMTLTTEYGSTEGLQSVLKMGMAEGTTQTLDQLSALLEHN